MSKQQVRLLRKQKVFFFITKCTRCKYLRLPMLHCTLHGCDEAAEEACCPMQSLEERAEDLPLLVLRTNSFIANYVSLPGKVQFKNIKIF